MAIAVLKVHPLRTLAAALALLILALSTSVASADGLTKPSNIKHTYDATGALTVSYTPGDNALGYLVFLFNADFTGNPETGEPVGDSYTFNGIVPGDYVAVVVAYDAEGEYVYELAPVHLAENPAVSVCPTQLLGGADLCAPMLPKAAAYMDWGWESDQDNFRELVTDFTIHNDVGEWSDEHGYYLILLQNSISGAGFYFGVQTDANGRGKGVIFSRWGTRDLANARWDATHGWTESAGHEGDFIGVRRSYDWGAGDYRIRLAPDGLDPDGEWFGLWIADLATDETTWIGSLKFPLRNGTATFRPHASATIELYGSGRIRPIDLPQWHVSVKRPLGDNVTAAWGSTGYPLRDGEGFPNSDVGYDPADGAAHLRVGGLTKRENAAVGRIDFATAPSASLANLRDGEWLEQNKPELANQLKALPWIADGIDDTEREAAEALIAAAIWHPDVF